MRRHTLLTAILLTSLIQTVTAQAPDSIWAKTIGYTGHEYFTTVEKTSDGGFILGGSTSSFFNDSTAYWLVRLDSEGDTVWTKVYRAEDKYDNACAIQTSDGGFAIAGDGDPWLIKTDANGTVEWEQALSAIGEGTTIYGFEETADSGFIATGILEDLGKRRAVVVKTDSTGAVVWNNTYEAEHDVAGLSITETSDGEIAVAGAWSHPTGGGVNHGWLLKLSAAGDSLWSVVYGDTADAYFKAIQEAADIGFIMIGLITLHSDTTSDTYLVKTDSLGVVEWEQIFGGIYGDEGMTVIQTSDLGYTLIVFGAVETGGDIAAWIVHTDTAGDTLWTLIPGDPTYYFGLDLVEIDENEYLVAGGRIDWDLGEAFGWLIRLGAATPVAVAEEAAITPAEFVLHANYPNPFNPATTLRFDMPETAEVTLVIHDLLGREVARLVEGQVEAGYHRVMWNGRTADGREMPTGVYIAHLVTPEYTRSIKMVLLK